MAEMLAGYLAQRLFLIGEARNAKVDAQPRANSEYPTLTVLTEDFVKNLTIFKQKRRRLWKQERAFLNP
jgi:hypothetical protein